MHWIRRFLWFHSGRHPRELAEGDVNRFLSHLAVRENVAASTQNQALAAVLFLYEQVLEQPLNRIDGVVRARKPKRLPVVLACEEVAAVLDRLEGVPRLVCTLQYGSGLRLLEALQLRVKDLDFGRGEILLRDARGRRDRVTMLPAALHGPLQDHLRRVREQHETDLAAGLGGRPYRTPSSASTRTPIGNGPGSGCFRLPPTTSILALDSGIATICTNRRSIRPCTKPPAGRA